MFYEYINLLPETMQKKISKYKRWQDKHAALFGKLLLKKDLCLPVTLDNIKFTDYSRPFLNALIDFNISHTSGCAMCALTKKGKIGLDIEAVTKLDVSQFEKYFSKAEWDEIMNMSAPTDQFFHFWTKKESVIKANGKGLNIPLCNFEVIQNSVLLGKNKWQITTLDMKEKMYKAHIAYNKKQPIEMIAIDFFSNRGL
jgi:4'-phosphopantetheinyl transferase